MSKDEGYDADADNPLADVTAAGDKREPVVMECACPHEGTAMLGKIDPKLRATDARRPTHQSTRNHRQQKRAACVFSSGTERAENAGPDDHAGGHKRSRGAPKRASR